MPAAAILSSPRLPTCRGPSATVLGPGSARPVLPCEEAFRRTEPAVVTADHRLRVEDRDAIGEDDSGDPVRRATIGDGPITTDGPPRDAVPIQPDPGAGEMPSHDVRVGCAGWSIPRQHADRFPEGGSHLARYAQRLPAVEVNSSFYRPHRPSTYARWAAETPEGFAFSLKIPKEITHHRRLVAADGPLGRFLDETAALGAKRGPLLVQLPPSLAFDAGTVEAFLAVLRGRHDGAVACEPRHPSWFAAEADRLLTDREVARVAADPAVVPRAADPGGWGGLVYRRLHGSPEMYRSAYPAATLDDLAGRIAGAADADAVWCIFDNTAIGAATADALAMLGRLRGR